MKKIILFSCLFIFSFFSYIEFSSAEVHFISKTASVESQNSEKPCPILGYTYTAANCLNGKQLSEQCPSNPKYYKNCGCDKKFQYNDENCLAPKTPSGESCGEKYEKCGCDTTIYTYNSANCSSPKVLSEKCSSTQDGVTFEKYKNCTCPSAYNQTCTGNMVPENASDVCDKKYKSCKCDLTKFKDCGGSTGEVGATKCSDSYGDFYTSCKALTCEDGGFKDSIPTGQTCTTVTYNSKTCYKDCKTVTCADGGFKDSIPSGQTCTSVSYNGKTCYKDCKAPTCEDGGYRSSKLSGGYGCKTKVTYNGLTCYKDCVQCSSLGRGCGCFCGGYESSCYCNEYDDYGCGICQSCCEDGFGCGGCW